MPGSLDGYDASMPLLADLKDRSPRWAKDAANTATRAYGLATAGSRPAPDFLIIGCKRGGTTSLFNYLLRHPGVLGLFPRPRGRKSTDYFFREGEHSQRWYRSHFHATAYRRHRERQLGHSPVGGEASPYYMWDPRVAARAHRVNPQLKAVALLRDPVERAWSHYQERVHNGVEPLSFTDALAAEAHRLAGEQDRMACDPSYYSEPFDWYSYRSRGVYLPQITNWTSTFPGEQLLVLRSEDLYSDAQGVFDQVVDYLGLPPALLADTRTFNAIAREKGSMPEDVRTELTAYYAAPNRALERHLGRPLHWGHPFEE